MREPPHGPQPEGDESADAESGDDRPTVRTGEEQAEDNRENDPPA